MSLLTSEELDTIRSTLAPLMVGHDVGGHGMDHFYAVHAHSVEALKHEVSLDTEVKRQIELAALLHDADDPKLFPQSKDYCNARKVLRVLNFEDEDRVIEMIDLVSCSKNGSRMPPQRYMAIPRDCDRLEAIGEIGIERCRAYNDTVGRPCHVDNTARVYDLTELSKVATAERYQQYTVNKNSDSMIDHYYDKLLHIGNSDQLCSQNPYILQEAAKRTHIMSTFVIDYWTRLSKSKDNNSAAGC